MSLRNTCAILSLAVLGLAAASASAGVNVSQVAAPAAGWPGVPTYRTYQNSDQPNISASRVPEVTSNTRVLAQTFTVNNAASTNILDSVSILAVGGGSATEGYELHLYDITTGSSLPGSYRPSTDGPSTPVNLKGVNLLPSAPQFFYGGAARDSLLQLDLTGTDEVALEVGHLYAMELWPLYNSGNSPLQWIRGGGGISVYPNGDGYEVNTGGGTQPVPLTNVAYLRSQLAGASRDYVMAIYTPEPSSLAAMGLVSVFARRRRA